MKEINEITRKHIATVKKCAYSKDSMIESQFQVQVYKGYNSSSNLMSLKQHKPDICFQH